MKSLWLRAVAIATCLLAITLALSSVAKASTTVTPEKVWYDKSPTDWAKIIQPGYRPHQKVFAELASGMSGDEAKRIVQNSADPFKEHLEITGTPLESRIIWLWGNSFWGAEGITAEVSRLMVTIENCRVTIVVIQFVGDYPARTFRQGRSKILGFPENTFGINEDKEK